MENKLFGSFQIKPQQDVDGKQIREAVAAALKGLGEVSDLYVGDDQPLPQPPR
jgi:hypothetical protein